MQLEIHHIQEDQHHQVVEVVKVVFMVQVLQQGHLALTIQVVAVEEMEVQDVELEVLV